MSNTLNHQTERRLSLDLKPMREGGCEEAADVIGKDF